MITASRSRCLGIGTMVGSSWVMKAFVDVAIDGRQQRVVEFIDVQQTHRLLCVVLVVITSNSSMLP